MDKLDHIMLYQVYLAWAGFELATLVVISTDCIGSYKSNYHTITSYWKSLPWKSSIYRRNFILTCNNTLKESYISIYMYIIPLLKNIYLTTTDLLLILNGKPDNTILLAIILSGFTECNEPVATNSCSPKTHNCKYFFNSLVNIMLYIGNKYCLSGRGCLGGWKPFRDLYDIIIHVLL